MASDPLPIPPAPLAQRLGRFALRYGYALARSWWRLRRPDCWGAHVALWVGEELLLVRPSYRDAFALPGGAIEPGEEPLEAARRELREETGIDLPAERLQLRCRFVVEHDHRQDHCHVYEARLAERVSLRPDGIEVVAAGFVNERQLSALALTPPACTYLRLRAEEADAAEGPGEASGGGRAEAPRIPPVS